MNAAERMRLHLVGVEHLLDAIKLDQILIHWILIARLTAFAKATAVKKPDIIHEFTDATYATHDSRATYYGVPHGGVPDRFNRS
jgi:hypothetical protein